LRNHCGGALFFRMRQGPTQTSASPPGRSPTPKSGERQSRQVPRSPLVSARHTLGSARTVDKVSSVASLPGVSPRRSSCEEARDTTSEICRAWCLQHGESLREEVARQSEQVLQELALERSERQSGLEELRQAFEVLTLETSERAANPSAVTVGQLQSQLSQLQDCCTTAADMATNKTALLRFDVDRIEAEQRVSIKDCLARVEAVEAAQVVKRLEVIEATLDIRRCDSGAPRTRRERKGLSRLDSIAEEAETVNRVKRVESDMSVDKLKTLFVMEETARNDIENLQQQIDGLSVGITEQVYRAVDAKETNLREVLRVFAQDQVNLAESLTIERDRHAEEVSQLRRQIEALASQTSARPSHEALPSGVHGDASPTLTSRFDAMHKVVTEMHAAMQDISGMCTQFQDTALRDLMLSPNPGAERKLLPVDVALRDCHDEVKLCEDVVAERVRLSSGSPSVNGGLLATDTRKDPFNMSAGSSVLQESEFVMKGGVFCVGTLAVENTSVKQQRMPFSGGMTPRRPPASRSPSPVVGRLDVEGIACHSHRGRTVSTVSRTMTAADARCASGSFVSVPSPVLGNRSVRLIASP